MVGVGLVAFVTVFGASLKTSFSGSLDSEFHGTHVVDSESSTAAAGSVHGSPSSSPRQTGVDVVSETRVGQAEVAGVPGMFQAFTAATIGQIFDLGQVDGDLTTLGPDGIAVQADLAAEHGWTLGSVVPVTLPSGDVELTVRAIYPGSEWLSSSFVDVAAFDKLLPGSLDARIYVSGDDAAVRAAAAAYPTGKVLDKEEFFDAASAQVGPAARHRLRDARPGRRDRPPGHRQHLRAVDLRADRELGLLRAVGMTRRQVRATIRGEAVIVALFGTSLGLAVGALFGWAAVRGLADEGVTTLTFPVVQLLAIAALGGLAGMAAAVLPARRGSRLKVLSALSAT